MPSTPTEKRRDLPVKIPGSTLVATGFSPAAHDFPDWGEYVGTQYTVSTGHPFKSRKKGDLADLGGRFFTEKKYFATKMRSHFLKVTTHREFQGVMWPTTTVYHGPIVPIHVPNQPQYFPEAVHSSEEELNAYGATAVARCKPTNPIADLSTAIGEIYREGLPHLVGSQTWKNRNQRLKNLGGDYLNVQFGWRPLLNEVSSFANAITHAKTVLEQYERDAGKSVRRQYRFPEHRSVEETVLNDSRSAILLGGSSEFYDFENLGRLVLTREIVQNRWFSGAFTYYLPTGYDSRKMMDKYALAAKKLFGLTPTPDTLWNLAPWSWAVDWFSSTGDVISNLTSWAIDGLVMHYGYIMEHTVVRDTYSLSDTGLIDRNVKVQPLTFVTETKIREPANPFGFGLTYDGLSPSQKAILVALGISKR